MMGVLVMTDVGNCVLGTGGQAPRLASLGRSRAVRPSRAENAGLAGTRVLLPERRQRMKVRTTRRRLPTTRGGPPIAARRTD